MEENNINQETSFVEPIAQPEVKKEVSSVVLYAGFWKRFLAYLIDAIILGVLFYPLSLVVDNKNIQVLISIIVGWLYYALMESSAKQGTLGKMALSIKVTDMNGNRILFGRASGRFFAKIISSIILYIGYIMIAFTKKKQGLHDLIAKTLVVKQ